MIPSLASLTYQPARLSRNPIVMNIEAADPDLYPDRSGLRYYCAIMIPESYLSGNYKQLVELEAAEAPPVSAGASTLYQGAFFEIQNQLDPLLSVTAPEFGQGRISVADGLALPYYCILSIRYNDSEIYRQALPVEYVVKSGISEIDYPLYKTGFFDEYIGANRRFLTWSQNPKIVFPDQPEFLYFLTNFSPAPTSLVVGLQATFSDLSTETSRPIRLDNILPFTGYCLPAGPEALGLSDHPKEVISYVVWLENQAGQRISELRYYQLNQEYKRNVRFVLFANSLGGFDTIAMLGAGEESLKLSRTTSERYNGYQFLPSFGETVVNSVSGLRQLSVASGWLDAAGLRYLEELVLSKEIYLAADRALLPLVSIDNGLNGKGDNEDLIGRTLAFQYTNATSNFSSLPITSEITRRPMGWRPKAMACLLDGNGLRTGLMQVTILEKYYLDDNKKVVGVPLKGNLPGTDGFLSPVESPSCSVTPFVNAKIEKAGTFLRATCAADQYGGPATVIIPAGTYGSEVSQADADAKAAEAWARTNTQAYADQFGSCVTGPEFYSWADIPAGSFHYRSNSPKNFYIYYDGSPAAGNSWTLPPGPNVYPMYSNDLNLPIQDKSLWKFLLINSAGAGAGRVTVYKNGVVVAVWTPLSYNSSVGRGLFAGGLSAGSTFVNVASGDRIYVKFEHLNF